MDAKTFDGSPRPAPEGRRKTSPALPLRARRRVGVRRPVVTDLFATVLLFVLGLAPAARGQAASLPEPATPITSITIVVDTPNPLLLPAGEAQAIETYGSTNDDAYLDLGAFCSILDDVPVTKGGGRALLEHGGSDAFTWRVPTDGRADDWPNHHVRTRLPRGLRVSDLTRCRLFVDHGKEYGAWLCSGFRLFLDGREVYSTRTRHWLGEEFGHAWDLPGFVPRPPAESPVWAERLELLLTFRGTHPWQPAGIGWTFGLVLNLGGVSWRLHDTMAVEKRKPEGDLHTWKFRLPLRAPVRAEQVRLFELYRVVEHPTRRWSHVGPDYVRHDCPPAPSSIEGVELFADGRSRYRKEGGVLPKEPGDRYFVYEGQLSGGSQ